MRWFIARLLEIVVFVATGWALFTHGMLAGLLGALTFLYVSHELKEV